LQKCVEKFVKNVKEKFPSITFKKLFQIISNGFRIQSKKQEKTRSTSATISHVFCKEILQSFFGKYGSQIGDRDHATVLHACKTVDNLVATDKQFKIC
jgi:chromosomal replication initiator protein